MGKRKRTGRTWELDSKRVRKGHRRGGQGSSTGKTCDQTSSVPRCCPTHRGQCRGLTTLFIQQHHGHDSRLIALRDKTWVCQPGQGRGGRGRACWDKGRTGNREHTEGRAAQRGRKGWGNHHKYLNFLSYSEYIWRGFFTIFTQLVPELNLTYFSVQYFSSQTFC